MTSRRMLRTRTVEAATAVALLLIAALMLWDSVRLGMHWADDGPQPGYFPFYVSAILAGAAAIILWRSLRLPRDKMFAGAQQLGPILHLLVPLSVFVAAAFGLGLYVSALLFMGYCMRVIGRYGWRLSLAVPAVIVVLLFLLFEQWFKVPLLKGPLEALLGLD